MAGRGQKSVQSASEDGDLIQPKTGQTAGVMFFAAVMDLTWQMALVVLVPVIGGYELDRLLKSTPSLLIVGFIVAMAGSFLVMRKALLKYGSRTLNTKEKHDRSVK